MKVSFCKIWILNIFFSLNSARFFLGPNLGLGFALKEYAFGYRVPLAINLNSKSRFAQRILKTESNLLKHNLNSCSDEELIFKARNLYFKASSYNCNENELIEHVKQLLAQINEFQLTKLLNIITNACKQKRAFNLDLFNTDLNIYANAFNLYQKIRCNKTEDVFSTINNLLRLFSNEEFKTLLQIFFQISANSVRWQFNQYPQL